MTYDLLTYDYLLFYLLKKILYISFLFALVCKIIEPMLLSQSFKDSADAEQFEVYEDQTRTIKIYQPMPYHNDVETQKKVSELYQEGDKFYHVVEQTYKNDTFYLKIQDNMSARERFFALGDAVDDLNFYKENKSSTPTKSTLSLEDLTKVFSPPSAPRLVRETFDYSTISARFQGEYLFAFSSIALAIATPPPNFSPVA